MQKDVSRETPMKERLEAIKHKHRLEHKGDTTVSGTGLSC